MTPRVSVVVPSYNRADLLPETLDSLVAQTMTDFEAVVVDDGSTDGTAEVVARYAPMVRRIWQENRGCAAACNHGIRETTAPCILILGSDDLLTPDCLQVLADTLDGHAEAGIAYGDSVEFGDCARPTRFFQRFPPRDGMVAAKVLLHFNLGAACSVMFRRSGLERVGLFDEGLRFAEEVDLWLRYAAASPCVSVPRVVSRVRASTVGKHWNPLAGPAHNDTRGRIRARFIEQHPEVAAQLSRRELAYVQARWHFDAGIWALRRRDRADARRLIGTFLKRCKHYPQGYWYYVLTFLPWRIVRRFDGELPTEKEAETGDRATR